MKLSDQIYHKPTLLTESGVMELERLRADSATVGGNMQDFYRPRPAMVIDANQIACIYICGVIGLNLCEADKKMGNTDTEDVMREIAEAQDNGCKGMLICINSPGGMVTGTPELADAVANSSLMGIPIFAHIQNQGSSAGYYSIAGASQIWACASALVGSIGIIFEHTDKSKAMEMMGLKNDGVTNTDATYKVSGGIWTEEQRSYFTSVCDRIAGIMKSFISSVRMGQVPDDAMRGQEFIGLDAQAQGLVDCIGSREECYAALLATVNLQSDNPELSDNFFQNP